MEDTARETHHFSARKEIRRSETNVVSKTQISLKKDECVSSHILDLAGRVKNESVAELPGRVCLCCSCDVISFKGGVKCL